LVGDDHSDDGATRLVGDGGVAASVELLGESGHQAVGFELPVDDHYEVGASYTRFHGNVHPLRRSCHGSSRVEFGLYAR